MSLHFSNATISSQLRYVRQDYTTTTFLDILTRSQYIGEEGSTCLLKAAVVVSNPWNLDVGSVALQSSWLGLEVYSKTMGSNMKKLFVLHADEITKNPRLDRDRVMKIKYLHEFDREVQGPTWGYPTEGAYYRDASSVDSLLAVKIPLFAINASDDPVSLAPILNVAFINKSRSPAMQPYHMRSSSKIHILSYAQPRWVVICHGLRWADIVGMPNQ